MILAGAFKDAISLILKDMQDPLLAITACRMLLLIHHDNPGIQSELDAIYDEHFIKRGESF